MTSMLAWLSTVLAAPVALLAVLALGVAAVFQLERLPALAPLFRRLPPVFWIYTLPMLAATAGLLPRVSPLYGALTRYLLPAALALILLSSDLRSIARLGPRALATMLGSAAGVALGAVAAFLLLGSRLGEEAWAVLAALTGTWIGGSANLLAVANALALSPTAQGIAILVDTVVAYSWMALLIALSARQATLDRWLRADRAEVAAVAERVAGRMARDRRPMTVADATFLIGFAIALSGVAMEVGRRLPPVGEVLTPFAWGVLLLTTAGVLLSLTPIARFDGAGASSLGYAGFYLLLAGVGAQADLRQVVDQPLWIVAGLVVIGVHGSVLFATLRLLRAPSFFFGTASQAAIGGYASAPVVAEVYQPGLAPVGLLLAVVGNLLGTYLGLGVGQLLLALRP